MSNGNRKCMENLINSSQKIPLLIDHIKESEQPKRFVYKLY